MPIKRDKEGVIIEITLTDDEEEELDEEAAAKKKKEEEDALKEVGMKMMKTPSSQSTSFWKKWLEMASGALAVFQNHFEFFLLYCHHMFFPSKKNVRRSWR